MLKGLFGRLLPDIAAVIFHEYPKERQLELIEACCAKEHEALLATPAPVYPGLVDALSILSRHYPLYIVSNCQAGYIEVFLEAQASVTISKAISVLAIPERQRQTTSVQSSNRTICSTRLCRDTDGDYKATREAGIPFVHAAYGFGQTENPDYTITSPMDLVTLFVPEN